MRACQEAPGWLSLTDVNKECIHHIIQKMQRIVCGNQFHKDHWEDIAGYADIAKERL